jgi:hypothetical protein
MEKKSNFGCVLAWEDDARPNLGEGVSRTTSASAVLWQVNVIIGGMPPMKTTVLANNKTEARKFSENRYPKATTITVIGKANAKRA